MMGNTLKFDKTPLNTLNVDLNKKDVTKLL